MKKSKRLLPVQKLAALKEDNAARALAQIQQQYAEELAKLEELRGYQQEYKDKLDMSARQGISPQLWMNYQRFLKNLSSAVEQQNATVNNLSAHVEQIRQFWLKMHHYHKNIGQLIDQNRLQEARDAEKKLQKELQKKKELQNNQNS